MFFKKTDTDKKQVVVTSDMIPMLEKGNKLAQNKIHIAILTMIEPE